MFNRKYMGVSKNRGTPKSSILIGFSIINHPFWGTPIFGNTHIFKGSIFQPAMLDYPSVSCLVSCYQPWSSFSPREQFFTDFAFTPLQKLQGNSTGIWKFYAQAWIIFDHKFLGGLKFKKKRRSHLPTTSGLKNFKKNVWNWNFPPFF